VTRKQPFLLAGIVGGLLLLYTLSTFQANPRGVAWDFHLYYMAGKLPAERLYQLSEQEAAERRIWEESLEQFRSFNFSPFLKPAYYRVALVPLAALPFWAAFGIWVALQLAAFVVALVVLARRYGFDPAYLILLPICPYFVRAMGWGQDTGIVFLLVVLAAEMMSRRRDGLAGATLALGLVKWNVMLLLPFVFLLHRRWKALGVFCAVGAAEVVLSVWITGFSGVSDYLTALHHPVADYLGSQMASLRGILLAAGVPNPLIVGIILAATLAALPLLRRLPLDQAFAMGVALSVFLSYHTMIYDLLFLLVPMLVFGTHRGLAWATPLTVLLLSPVPQYVGRATGDWVVGLAAAAFLVAVLAGLLKKTWMTAPGGASA
jgi:hypothetical protein